MARPRMYSDEERKLRKKEYEKKYKKTPMGRASILLSRYNYSDKEAGRGRGDLTPEWIVENIFSKPCKHCGKTGWDKIGCNRLDNSKPHTMDNVEPCCKKCNCEQEGEGMAKKVYQYSIDGELIKIWNSTSECNKNGYECGNVSKCCNGIRNTYKNCVWRYVYTDK